MFFHVLARRPAPHVRLYCFPYAGGGTTTYFHWGRMLPSAIEVVGCQLPGRERLISLPPVDSMRGLVDLLCPALVDTADLPFAFFGHSNGALLAFELTRELGSRYGITPAHLFVSACRAPHVPQRSPFRHRLSDSDLFTELKALNGTTDAVLASPEIIQLLLPTIRADMKAGETYRYQAGSPLPCSITACSGELDTEVYSGDIAEWRRHTTGRFVHRTYPGDHFFLNAASEPLLADLAVDLMSLGSCASNAS